MSSIHDELDMESVVAKQDLRDVLVTMKPHELRGVSEFADATITQLHRQGHRRFGAQIELRNLAVRSARDRDRLIKETVDERNDPLATHRVVARTAIGTLAIGNDVGTVERVVQAIPARVRGVESEACVIEWHDKLRSGDERDLRVDVVDIDGNRCECGLEIANLGEEATVLGNVARTGMRRMPLVELLL